MSARATVDIETLVPKARVAAFLDEAVEDSGTGEPTIERIGDGRSNLTFLVRRGERRWVLRRPPAGALPGSAHDMLREHRVLVALRRTEVPAPEPVAVCEDLDVLGVPFYLMRQVPGVVIRDTEPDGFTDEDRHRVGVELIDALAALHTVDHADVGLADLGRPAGFTARQIDRWTRQWSVMRTRELPDIERVRGWLEDHCPAEHGHAIVHGDYKLDNVVLSAARPPRVAAVLDWELATLGDPLTDVGYLMNCWPQPGEPGIPGIPQPTTRGGYPTRQELLARYAERTGTDVPDLTFYRVLAMWKMAVLLEGLYKRFLSGHSADDWPALLEQGVPEVASRAREMAGV